MKKYYILAQLLIFISFGYSQVNKNSSDCDVVITAQPQSQIACEGQSASFYLTAYGPEITYQWMRDEQVVSSGYDNFSISNVTAADAGDYYCIITGTCWAVYSQHVQLSVNPHPVITIQPAAQVLLCPGSSFSLSISTTAPNPTYIWYHNDMVIPDAFGNSIVVNNAQYYDAGNYYCAVSESNCVTNSNISTVNQVESPTFNPQDYTPGNTLANISVNGTNIKWYASFEDAIAYMNVLPLNTPLVEGNDYYVTQTINGCESVPNNITIHFLGIPNLTEEYFKAYPNPVATTLKLESKTVMESIQVYSIIGQELLSKNINAIIGEIDLSKLNSGTYIAVIESDKGRQRIKFIKQ